VDVERTAGVEARRRAHVVAGDRGGAALAVGGERARAAARGERRVVVVPPNTCTRARPASGWPSSSGARGVATVPCWLKVWTELAEPARAITAAARSARRRSMRVPSGTSGATGGARRIRGLARRAVSKTWR
jgi:hypothetical protein